MTILTFPDTTRRGTEDVVAGTVVVCDVAAGTVVVCDVAAGTVVVVCDIGCGVLVVTEAEDVVS